jgi:hypothetical protein
MDHHTGTGAGRHPQKYLFALIWGHAADTIANVRALGDEQLQRSGWMNWTGGTRRHADLAQPAPDWLLTGRR